MTKTGAPIVTSRARGWIKPLRAFLWLTTIVLVALGIGVQNSSTSPDAFIDGSTDFLTANANALLSAGVIIGALNIIWGCTRWFVHCYEGHWNFKKILGKLIGGGIWRTLVFASLGLIILTFAAPPLAIAIRDHAITANLASSETSVTKLETAFKNKEISADDYVNYLLDAAYDSSALPEKYRDDKLMTMPDILTVIDENLDKIKPETALEALNVLSLADIEFGDTPNESTNSSLFTTNVYAKSGVKTLNKAIASSSNHFVVFYTDTGDDSISADAAKKIGEMMESFITGYKSEFDLDYHTEQIHFRDGAFNNKRSAIKKVMENNGISADLIDSAMPIYIINPYKHESNVLATYAGRRFNDTISRIALSLAGILSNDETGDISDFYNSSPVLPFINILPENIENESLELVVAHEFGHHYSANYCYDNFDRDCSTNDFIDETLPNYTAATVVKNQPKKNLLTYHLDEYIKHTDAAIYDGEAHSGYSALTFLENYANLVPSGKTKIFNALVEDDAYWYLYGQAGETAMADVLETLAVKNVTNDYGDRYSFYANTAPSGYPMSCDSICSNQYNTASSPYASSSIHYFYFPLAGFNDKIVKIENANGASYRSYSILGRRGGSWSEISTYRNEDFELDFAEDYNKYDTLLLAIADYSPKDAVSSSLTIEVTTKELDPVTEETIDFFGVNGNCIWFYTDGIFDAAKSIVNVFSGIDDDLDAAITDWNAEVDERKQEVGHRKVTICGQRLRPHKNLCKRQTVTV